MKKHSKKKPKTDMKTWDIQKTQFKVADFVNWAKNKELDLSPSFQRRAVWSKGAKSYLLDTILRGLPIPPVILRDLPPNVRTFESVREVVDGQQRLRTLLTFIAPHVVKDFRSSSDEFTLSKSHNADLAGYGFLDLSEDLQRIVLNYQFMVHIFPSETDDRDILEIFARMNATGTKLNNQELRNAAYFGEFKTKAFALASENLARWRSWELFSEADIARMAEVEFTSELLIFILNGVSDNKKSVIDLAYITYDTSFPKYRELAKRLRHVLDLLDTNLANSYPEVLSSKALVYPLFASIYDKCFGIGCSLSVSSARKITKSAVTQMAERGVRLLDGKAPRATQIAMEARTSQAKNRRIITKYLVNA